MSIHPTGTAYYAEHRGVCTHVQYGDPIQSLGSRPHICVQSNLKEVSAVVENVL